jgi:hypothetical protein
MGEDRGVYRVLVGKPEGKRSLVRPRRRWEEKIFRPILLKQNRKSQLQNYVFFHRSFNIAVLSAEFNLR